MKTLAIFDFDKTLYEKDSMIEFTKFTHGNLKFYIGMLVLLPYLIIMKIGIYSNENAKKKFLNYFFKNWSYTSFLKNGNLFAENEIQKNLNLKIFKEFQNHLFQNHTVLIVTASLPEWIEKWAKQYKVRVIGTKINSIEDIITSNFIHKNCNGKEKVRRISETLNLNDYDTIYVYGKGKGDREMLLLKK